LNLSNPPPCQIEFPRSLSSQWQEFMSIHVHPRCKKKQVLTRIIKVLYVNKLPGACVVRTLKYNPRKAPPHGKTLKKRETWYMDHHWANKGFNFPRTLSQALFFVCIILSTFGDLSLQGWRVCFHDVSQLSEVELADDISEREKLECYCRMTSFTDKFHLEFVYFK